MGVVVSFCGLVQYKSQKARRVLHCTFVSGKYAIRSIGNISIVEVEHDMYRRPSDKQVEKANPESDVQVSSIQWSRMGLAVNRSRSAVKQILNLPRFGILLR